VSLWIKICANTSLEDAQLAADAGADAAGFVFAPSPRRVTPQQAAAIVPHLPAGLEKIGVFVDAAFEEIASTVAVSGLTGVQLHFDAAPELTTQLHARFGPQLRILRVVHFDAAHTREPSLLSGHDFSRAKSAGEAAGALAPEAYLGKFDADAVLVDSRTASAVGGTGKVFDWAAAGKTLFHDANARKLVAAGGLTPENVAEAIALMRPWGVDVVSGVEAAPGRKDAAKVRAFVAKARATQS
jgi:phosphoribosylanthranilate isomerase